MSGQDRDEATNAEGIPTTKCKTEAPTTPEGAVTGQWTSVPASPPKYISFEQLMSAANGVKNMTLAHEIVVDSNFKIATHDDQFGLKKQVHDIVHKAFWDSLHEDLNSDPPVYTAALDLLEELKTMLLSLTLPQHTRLKAQIDEVFDMALIKQQVEHNSLDIWKFTAYVVDTLAKLCAPVRDEAIETLRKKHDLVPLFQGIFELMEDMRMDMANFTITQMRPYLQQQSVEYERLKFNEFLKTQTEAGVDGLLLTRQWLQAANKLISGQEVTSASGSQTSLVTPAAVLNQAYLMLLTPNLYDDFDSFPETLLMDAHRFRELQQKTWKLTLVSAMLLVTYNTAGSPIAGIPGFKEKLKSQIIIILEGCRTTEEVRGKAANVSDQLIKELNLVLKEHNFTELTSTQKNLMTAQINEVISEDHPVHRLISDRVMEFILCMVSKEQAGPLKIPSGLAAVKSDLSEVCGPFLRLVSHNRSVFSQHYGEIIDLIVQRDGSATNIA